MSIIKMFMNKIYFKLHNVYKTRGEHDINLRLIKRNTTLMLNYYIRGGIKLFNQPPTNKLTYTTN